MLQNIRSRWLPISRVTGLQIAPIGGTAPFHTEGVVTLGYRLEGETRVVAAAGHAAKRCEARAASALLRVEGGSPASTWLPQANGGAKQLTQHVTCRMALVSLMVPVSMPIAFGVGRMTRSTLRRRASCRT
jgi:hypothetical protein